MKNIFFLLAFFHSLLINCGLVLPSLANNTLLKYEGAHTSEKIRIPILQSQNLGVPPNNGAPKGSGNGAASRGLCNPESLPQSLTPSSGIGIAMTDKSTVLYFFIPQSSILSAEPSDETVENIGGKEKEKVTFTLSSITTEKILYENQLELDLPVLLNLDLAKANPPIVFETGQTYQWTLTVNCDLTDEVSAHPSVSGLIRKVAMEPSIVAESEVMSLGDRPLFYADQGLQYDAIAALIELIQTEPDNPKIEAIWQELLPEVSLDVVKPALSQTLED